MCSPGRVALADCMGKYRPEQLVAASPVIEAADQAVDGRLGNAAAKWAARRHAYHSTTTSEMTKFQTSILTSERIMSRSSSSCVPSALHTMLPGNRNT